ncbi:MAG TPA: type I-C CRISPR-associated protein Cas8c/Csd1 [Ruminiclostridium sp.]
MKMLYDTYENCIDEVGKQRTDGRTPLLPIAHSTQNAQLEVVIDGNGIFKRARVLGKDEEVTIIPVTEDSASRSSGIAPHPLCDKLQYVAGDFSDFVDKKNGQEYYLKYLKQLEDWCSSAYGNKKVNAVLSYLRKKALIADLIKYKLLICDENGMLVKGVKLAVSDQSDAFVRFRVEISGQQETAVWLDTEVYVSYIGYYLSLQKDMDLCYVNGKKNSCSEKHPAKVRNTADKSKLISANDSAGFTYRGRFADKNQVVSIGYETSQKAHNALRWLVNTQGYTNGDQVIIAWGTRNQTIPQPLEDTQDVMFEDEDTIVVSTSKEYAGRINKAIAGYGYDLDTQAKIVVMGLDAATTGRLSITYYRELNGSDFLCRIKKWHSTCVWQHTYKRVSDGVDDKGKPKFRSVNFTGAPAPKDIAVVAFGTERNERLEVSNDLLKSTIERLLPCIIDGARIPYDIVNSVVNRASNPVSMNYFNWNKTLSIACSLVKKYRCDKFKEEWDMALDENQSDRSYLFGRMLAIAQQIEVWALNSVGEKRDTNAERLMHQFKLHPYRTWGILTDKLKPYISRLGGKGTSLVELMTKVNSMVPYDQFTSLKQLEDSYVLGYYCQRQVFLDEKNQRFEELNQKKIENFNEKEK